jgi:hypothetical protein
MKSSIDDLPAMKQDSTPSSSRRWAHRAQSLPRHHRQVATKAHGRADDGDTVGVPPPMSYAVLVIDRLKSPSRFAIGLGSASRARRRAADRRSVAHTAVTASAARAQLPMEDVVMSLLACTGKDLGIKTEVLRVSKFVLDLAKVSMPPNRPIVGDSSTRWSPHHRRLVRNAQGQPAQMRPSPPIAWPEAGEHHSARTADYRRSRWCEKLGVSQRGRTPGDAAAIQGESFEEGSADGGRVQEIVARVMQKAPAALARI